MVVVDDEEAEWDDKAKGDDDVLVDSDSDEEGDEEASSEDGSSDDDDSDSSPRAKRSRRLRKTRSQTKVKSKAPATASRRPPLPPSNNNRVANATAKDDAASSTVIQSKSLSTPVSSYKLFTTPTASGGSVSSNTGCSKSVATGNMFALCSAKKTLDCDTPGSFGGGGLFDGCSSQSTQGSHTDSLSTPRSVSGTPSASTSTSTSTTAGIVLPEGVVGLGSHEHNAFDFLKPSLIKDKQGRRPDHPAYNPRTVYVPDRFLQSQTPAMVQWWYFKSENMDTVLFFKVHTHSRYVVKFQIFLFSLTLSFS
jgi:DNA mismatch repair protein MSH6